MNDSIANIKHPGNYYLVLLNNILSYLFQVFPFKETELDDTPQPHFSLPATPRGSYYP